MVARVHLGDFGAIFTAVAEVAWFTGHCDGHSHDEYAPCVPTARTIVETLNDSYFRGTGGASNLQAI